MTRNRELSRHHFFSESGTDPSSVYSLKTKICESGFLRRALSRALEITPSVGNSIWMPTIFNGGKGRSCLAAAIAVKNQAKGINKIKIIPSKPIQDFFTRFL